VSGPAYLATPSMHVIAWNTALSAVFGDMALVPPENRNMLWLVFASPSHRASIPNWDSDARAMLARFRIEYGRHRDDPAFHDLIERLQLASAEFSQWWPAQNVSVPPTKSKRFEVIGAGAIELEQSIFLVEDAPDMRLVVYSAIDPDSARKVELLWRQWMARSKDTSS
jgi:hypothetical protein